MKFRKFDILFTTSIVILLAVFVTFFLLIINKVNGHSNQENTLNDSLYEAAIRVDAPMYGRANSLGIVSGLFINLNNGQILQNGENTNQPGIWMAIIPSTVITDHPIVIDTPQIGLWSSGESGTNLATNAGGLHCSVKCRSGYYACCGDSNGVWCRCRRNGTPDRDCIGGGEGSEVCEIDNRNYEQ